MAVVQRLTGLSSGDFFHDGSVSPAARLAATEKASPRELTRPITTQDSSDDDLREMLKEVDAGQIPGILSPAPAMLPPVPTGFFSPASTDANSQSFLNDNFNMSPFFMASPSEEERSNQPLISAKKFQVSTRFKFILLSLVVIDFAEEETSALRMGKQSSLEEEHNNFTRAEERRPNEVAFNAMEEDNSFFQPKERTSLEAGVNTLEPISSSSNSNSDIVAHRVSLVV
ncbi:hypothetical protein POTOM_028656 [Populus tomentosa]|uniref:Uncharacterized protein n=1 Tax=Populus tomentosa TaxID=118781 RepID=A0A8X8CLK2_POPTO|nr:hypothetical protein POTOM_028656 [Populus tomentosa]